MQTDPQFLGVLCAILSTMFGLAYLLMADAPPPMLAVNFGSLAIGLVLIFIGRRLYELLSERTACSMIDGAMLAAAMVLLATSLFGEAAEGASRWFAVGGLFVQPSLIVLPVMVIGFMRRRNRTTMSAMLVAALAMALQPDRAMAAALFAGLAVQAFLYRDRVIVVPAAVAFAALVVTLLRADSLPAVPYVDRIYYTAFEIGLSAGIAVVVGTVLLLVPFLAVLRHKPKDRNVGLIFAVVWFVMILMAMVGNYPTPVVGYSGAAVLGYVLSLLALPTYAIAARHNADEKPIDMNDPTNDDGLRRVLLPG